MLLIHVKGIDRLGQELQTAGITNQKEHNILKDYILYNTATISHILPYFFVFSVSFVCNRSHN
jgi:hypothetical protein